MRCQSDVLSEQRRFGRCSPSGPNRWGSSSKQTGASVLCVAGQNTESRLAGNREVFTQDGLNDGFPCIVPHSIKDQHPNAPVRITGQNRRQLALQLAAQEPDHASGPIGKRRWICLNECCQAEIECIQSLANSMTERARCGCPLITGAENVCLPRRAQFVIFAGIQVMQGSGGFEFEPVMPGRHVPVQELVGVCKSGDCSRQPTLDRLDTFGKPHCGATLPPKPDVLTKVSFYGRVRIQPDRPGQIAITGWGEELQQPPAKIWKQHRRGSENPNCFRGGFHREQTS